MQKLQISPVLSRINARPEPIRLLIVDDEDIVRYGLRAICQVDAALSVVGEASNGRAAIARTRELQPDLVLMDIRMPRMDGVAATREICQAHPETKVLILTAHENDKYLIEAMREGASGYLLKNTPPEDFAHIIHAAHKGYLQIGPTLGQKLCQQLKSPASKKVDCGQKGITPREREVLALIAEGASNREIAQILHITEKTVKNHVSSLLSRVGLRDRTQLAIWQTQVSA